MVSETEQTEKMTPYKHLALEEQTRLETSGSAMYHSLDHLMGMAMHNGQGDTEFGKCFAKALETAYVIREELLNHKKRLYVYAPQRYLTARKNVDEGMSLLGEVAGFEKMKEQGKECQDKMDVYADVWSTILTFDEEHTAPYTQRMLIHGRHAFSGKKASMDEMLRDLKAMEE